ncbi:MAG: HAD family hydrolase, partial [Alphaproteobacteria bacterium]
ADIAAVARGYREAFHDLCGAEGVLYDGATEILTLLGGTGVLGVATGKGRNGLSRVLAWHGIDHHFSVLKTADDGPGKPAPDIVLDAMAETGFAEHQTWVIGDTTYDMEMAYNAGVTAIGVAWGYHDAGRLAEAGAAAVAQSFEEIPDLLQALRRAGPNRGRGT